jgi:two-component system, cell cycle response regulator DivK
MTKILYIEDNTMNMRLVGKFLQAMNIQLLWASDGLSGLEMALEKLPDMILMDINLPSMDGMAVMSVLRQQPSTADLPIIAVTANAMHGDRERYLIAGFNDYLAKPLARQELINTIQRHLPILTIQAGS